MKIAYVDAICGAGKTTAAIERMIEDVKNGSTFLLIQPRKELIDQTEAAIRELDATIPVRKFYKENDNVSVTKRIHDHLDCREDGEIMITTHAAFQHLQKRPFEQRRDFSDIDLIVDECPRIFHVTHVAAKRVREDLLQHLEVRPGQKGGYSTVKIKDGCTLFLKELMVQARKDKSLEPLYYTAEALDLGMKTWVSTSHYEEFAAGSSGTVTFYHVIRPSIFAGFRSVTIMGANFTDSEIYRLWGQWGIKFAPSARFKSLAATHPESIGNALDIYYLCDEWSNTIKKKDQKIYEEEFKRAVRVLFGQEPFIYTANYSDDPRLLEGFANGKFVSPMAHGQNDYREYDNAAVYGHFNLSADQTSFLHHIFGLKPSDAWDLRNKDLYYQFVCRTSLRSVAPSARDQISPKKIIVMDKDMALYLQRLFPGSRVHKFPSEAIEGIEMPIRGRRPIGPKAATGTERSKRSRDNKEAQEDQRKLKILQVSSDPFMRFCNENTLIRTSDVSFGEKEWHLSLMGNLKDIHVNSMRISGWNELVDFLRTMSQRQLPSKSENLLFNATEFEEIDGERRRRLQDCIETNVLLMDMDSDLNCCPTEFSNLLSGLEMVIYSSYSSTPQHRRWRVVVRLSRAVVDKEYNRIAKDLLRICANHGFAFDKKVRSNDFMYLPGHGACEEGYFFHHLSGEDRQPLNVDDWLGNEVVGSSGLDVSMITTIQSSNANTGIGVL